MPHGCEWKCSSECKKVACTTGRISSLLFTAGFTYCSVIQLCPTLCDPMDFSMPGFPVLHHLPKLLKLMLTESVMPSNHLILCHPLLLLPSIFTASESYPISWLFTLGGQSTGASASVLPVNIQDWFPLGWTGWLSFQSKGLSTVFSNTTIQNSWRISSLLWHSTFFIVQLSHPYMTTGKTIALTRWIFVAKVMSLLFNMLYMALDRI